MEITICEILFSSFIPIINIILFCFILLMCQIVLIWIMPGGSDSKEPACSVGDPGLIPGLGRFPWRRAWQPTPVFLSGEFHGQRSPVGYSPWSHKESDRAEWLTPSFFLLSAYKFRNFASFWQIKPFDIMNCSPFSLEELFSLKTVLSTINVANSDPVFIRC